MTKKITFTNEERNHIAAAVDQLNEVGAGTGQINAYREWAIAGKLIAKKHGADRLEDYITEARKAVDKDFKSESGKASHLTNLSHAMRYHGEFDKLVEVALGAEAKLKTRVVEGKKRPATFTTWGSRRANAVKNVLAQYHAAMTGGKEKDKKTPKVPYTSQSLADAIM